MLRVRRLAATAVLAMGALTSVALPQRAVAATVPHPQPAPGGRPVAPLPVRAPSSGAAAPAPAPVSVQVDAPGPTLPRDQVVRLTQSTGSSIRFTVTVPAAALDTVRGVPGVTA